MNHLLHRNRMQHRKLQQLFMGEGEVHMGGWNFPPNFALFRVEAAAVGIRPKIYARMSQGQHRVISSLLPIQTHEIAIKTVTSHQLAILR